MSLYCKLGNRLIQMSEIWVDEESFNQIGSDGIKELVQEDLIQFIIEIDLLDHCEFFWRDE